MLTHNIYICLLRSLLTLIHSRIHSSIVSRSLSLSSSLCLSRVLFLFSYPLTLSLSLPAFSFIFLFFESNGFSDSSMSLSFSPSSYPSFPVKFFCLFTLQTSYPMAVAGPNCEGERGGECQILSKYDKNTFFF